MYEQRIRVSKDKSNPSTRLLLTQPMMEGDEENLALVGAVGFVPNFIEEAKW